ncbi:FAS1-like dehydratase domain-containing protein [Gulosibacter bifidus]|uniref:MaoC family dehydratase N-terminal domain-containing protein n=1 Tax=Gulosibacter bifidus TaxID=272239 RepID=A0ABW5RJP6_9MICO|nr:MaoC family dehydratase N-terminal domain-containing protein [Gulosibacter bifidus]
MTEQQTPQQSGGLSQELVGRTFALAEPYLVGREHIRDFAQSVFATNPIHTDVDTARAAGYLDLVAPATYLAVLQHRVLEVLMHDPQFDVELKNIVHGDQRFTFDRPVVAGDEIRAELEVSGLRSLGGRGTMVQATTTYTDANGDAIATSNATLVVGGGN